MASVGAGGAVRWRVASVTERNAIVVGQDEVGMLVHVLAGRGELHPAILAGTGASCWGEPERGGFRSYTRTFAFSDAAIDIAAVTAAINLGDPLPVGSIVMGVIADVTVDWTDGGAGVFSADVGIASGDADLYTPTALDIDGGIALLTQAQCQPASGVQLAVTFDGDVNLGTMTAGSMALTVLYVVPEALAV